MYVYLLLNLIIVRIFSLWFVCLVMGVFFNWYLFVVLLFVGVVVVDYLVLIVVGVFYLVFV